MSLIILELCQRRRMGEVGLLQRVDNTFIAHFTAAVVRALDRTDLLVAARIQYTAGAYLRGAR